MNGCLAFCSLAVALFIVVMLGGVLLSIGALALATVVTGIGCVYDWIKGKR